MNAYDWYNVLTPLALLAGCLNVLMGISLKPEYRSAKIRKFSIMGYCSMAIGWCIMFFATTFLKSKPILMTNIAIVGWLLLLPSLILVTVCLFTRLRNKKENFSLPAQKVGFLLYKLLKICCVAFVAIVTVGITFLSHRPKKQNSFDEDNINTFESNGGPHIFTDPPENILGRGSRTPSNDPLSHWSQQ